MRAEWETDPIVLGRASRESPILKYRTQHIVPSFVVVSYCSVLLTMASLAAEAHDNTKNLLTTHNV